MLASGGLIYDRVYEGTDSASTSELNRAPLPIDGNAMLLALVDRAVNNFARVILPWPDSVEVEFTDCGGGEGCDEAFRALQRNDLQTAEAIYTRILGPYENVSTVPDEEDAEIVAETLFNRGVVRAYTGSYELGIADIQRALAIQPNHDDWRVELARIEALAAEQDQLRQQIEGVR
jgi:tetratricopeptide (TPR) repeat protein